MVVFLMTDWIALDFETSGLLVGHGARVLEVGLVLMRGDQEIEHFQAFIRGAGPVPEMVTRMTGITDEDLAQGQSVEEVVAYLQRKLLRASFVVAHGTSFERRFLAALCARANGFPPKIFWRCSLEKAKSLFGSGPMNLAALLARTSVQAPLPRHRALNDARAYAALWLKLQAISPDPLPYRCRPR